MNLRAFQCFAAGTHTDMHGHTLTMTAADLDNVAAAYDPRVMRAPLVLGHPKPPADEFGFVIGLHSFAGKLYAIADVADELITHVKAKRYKNVSASFLTPVHPGNPAGGGYYLNHIGFLGAVPPAVKGMAPLNFAARAAAAHPSGGAFADPNSHPFFRAGCDLHAATGQPFHCSTISAASAYLRSQR